MKIFKQVIVVVAAGFIVYILYFGSFLPIRKSQKYIRARQTQITSLAQFDALYDGVLSYTSPVGQDEIVSNYVSMLTEIIAEEKRKESPNETLIRHLVGKAEEWGEPIIERGVGFNFSQFIFNMANIYQEAMFAVPDRTYYQKGVELYRLGLKYSPDRQLFLYSLFDMYRFRGDNENARKIGERIVEVYKDERVKQVVQSL